MKIKPILTEKSLNEAKKGRYTFEIPSTYCKGKIRKLVEDTFGVNVVGVSTMNYKGGKRRNFRGQIQKVRDRKKAVVILKDKQKIDLFETKEKKK